MRRTETRGREEVEDPPDSEGEEGPVRGEERGQPGEGNQGVRLRVYSWWVELERGSYGTIHGDKNDELTEDPSLDGKQEL